MLIFKPKDRASSEVRELFNQRMRQGHVSLDRVFLWLLLAQWVFGIGCSLLVSPLVWEGASSGIHTHVWASVLLGGLIVALPIAMVIRLPGHMVTRCTIATAQTMFSALLIHLMGGRIEAHFHVFVSLALLAGYRDRTVFIPAVAVTLIDHIVRGFLWPQSVFGVLTVVSWRPFEHGAWVLFETVTLCFLIRDSLSQQFAISRLECSLRKERDELEARVMSRTKELNDAKLFQERILNSIEAAICILDENGEVLFVNNSWAASAQENGGSLERTGVGAQNLEKCRVVDGQLQVWSGEFAVAIRDICGGRHAGYSTEYSYTTEESERWFHVSATPVPMDGTRAVAVVHVDVTAMETARARAASMAKLILDSPNEVFVFSRDTLQFVEVNHGACCNLGYSRDELLKMTPFDIKPNYSESDLRELLQPLAAEKMDVLNFETSHQRRDGSTYECSLSLHLSVLENQDVVVAFVNDVSERKRLESQLRESQKLQAVGQLAAGVAHEINTPMQCVFGNVEFLESSFDRLLALSDELIELLDQSNLDWSQERNRLTELRSELHYDHLREQTPSAIKEAAEASNRVISIIRAMKVMSHPGSNEKTLTDIHEMIQNAATITRSRWKHHATVEFDFDPNLAQVEVLAAEISQVFVNLIVNAADAIGEKIGDEPSELGEIRIATKTVGDMLAISISDSGAGIPQSIVDRIFEPFYTTKCVGQGTGQGLSISHNVIVNQHSGTFDVTSQEGVGTRFEIRIPRFASPKETSGSYADSLMPECYQTNLLSSQSQNT